MKATQVLTLIVTAKYFIYINSLDIIPEAAKVVYVNPKYVVNASVSVRRYGRHSPYVVNSEGTTLVTFGDNVTIDVIFYEYLHNEYKRSFIEFHFRGCSSIINDHFIGDIFKNGGIKCPFPPTHYVLRNMTFMSIPAVEDMRYKWPFQKAKIVTTIHTYPGKEMISEVYGIASFKETKSNKKIAIKKQ